MFACARFGSGQRSENGGQKSEIGGQMSEVGGQMSEVRGRRTEDRCRRSVVGGQGTETGRRLTFDLLGKSEGSLSLNLTFCRFLKFGLLDICVLHCLYNHNHKQNPGMNLFHCFRHRNRLVCL